ncbi:MAG: CinA family protein [Chitinophagaceae bacterium]|nr:CinA family protein [Oligoflexus sp.]
MLGNLHDECLARKVTLATAESCTGGLISSVLTSKSGSSAYFLGGVCSYSNEVKTKLLGVPAELIKKMGAVSDEVAKAMAEGACDFSGADYTVSVTGIAGPGGGTQSKPVGTIYCAWTTANGTDVERLQLKGDRDSIRAQTCLIALAGLLSRILMNSKEVS